MVPVETLDVQLREFCCRIPTPRWLWSWLNVTKFIDPMLVVVLCVSKVVGGIVDRCRAWTGKDGRFLALWAAVGRSDGGLEEVRQREQHVCFSAVTSSLEGNRSLSDAWSAASRTTPGIS